MNTTIPSGRAVASNLLRLHPVRRILATGLSALLALSIQLASTAHADPPVVTLTRLHSFGDPLTDAANPQSRVIDGSDGVLYGTTGGQSHGTVFRVNKDGTGFAVLKSFGLLGTDGVNPVGGVTEGSDGALYGTTREGGTFGAGTVFRVNKDGTGFAVLKSFDNETDGGYTHGGVTEGSDGALYGTTSFGGPSGGGTVFRVNKDGGGFAVIKSFDVSTEGGDLYGDVTEGSDGALYGTAMQRGISGGGTVFRVNKDGSGFTVLKSFGNGPGAVNPVGVTEGSDGVLYGTTFQGGVFFSGTVFRVNKDGTGFAVLKSLNGGTDGRQPECGVTEGSDGALYGTTFSNGAYDSGTVFRVNKDGTGFAVLKSLNGGTDGGTLYGGVTEGSDGALYGTAYQGGASGSGTVFRVNKDGTGFVVIKSLNIGTDGRYLYGGVTEGSDGALYGTAQLGGDSGHGTVFRVNKDGTGFAVLKNFDSATDGANPGSSLTEGSDGALYGTTPYGGTYGYGTVFRMNKNGSEFAVIKSFGDHYETDGANLYASVTEGSDGALYGAAYAGGAYDGGTLFRLNKDGSGFGVLTNFYSELISVDIDGMRTYSFPDGGRPSGQVAEGSDGALYGIASQGGLKGAGTVFRVSKDGTGFAVLRSLDPATDGANAGTSLTEGSGGALYGTTPNGGSYGYGTVFRLNKDGSGFEVLQALGSSEGGPHYPYGKVVFGGDGRLYGTSFQGGDCNLGTVFALQIGAPNQSPALLNPGNQTVIAGTPLAFTLTATDPNPAETLTYSILSGAQPGMNLDATSGTFTWTPSQMQGPGAYAVTFRVTDSGGLAADQSITIAVAEAPIEISSISPASGTANGSGFTLTVDGNNFDPGTVVSWNGTARPTTNISSSQVTAQIPATDLQVTGDFVTALVTVTRSTGASSSAVAFTIIGASVSNAVGQVDSGVASAGETVSVQTPPTAPDLAGVTAALENSTGTTPATVTAATYTENPTPAAAFEAGGGFVDLKVSGADAGDRLSSSFYYPQIVTGGAEDALMLKFFNGSQWLDVLSSGGIAPIKNTQDNLDGTVSGGRFQVVFDNTSTPMITELNGTVFAVAIPDTTRPTVTCPNVTVPCNVNLLVPVNYPTPTVSDNIDPAPRVTYSIPSGSTFRVGNTTVTCTAVDAAGNAASTTFNVTRAPLQFTGFLAPISGADATGGSFAAPVRTFKAGSTIPVKFSATCGGTPVTTGIHRLQAMKYSDATTGGTPIDATPQDAATTGNQFRLSGQDWLFNLNTKSTGLITGIWQLAATLSDGSQHTVWVQLK